MLCSLAEMELLLDAGARKKRSAPRGISATQVRGVFRTHDTRFKVWGANHYTMGAVIAQKNMTIKN